MEKWKNEKMEEEKITNLGGKMRMKTSFYGWLHLVRNFSFFASLFLDFFLGDLIDSIERGQIEEY